MRLMLVAGCAALLASVGIYGRGFYGSGAIAVSGQGEAGALVASLHAEMAKHDWDGIYANADASYRRVLTPEESAKMFARVVQTLGEPVSCKPGKTVAGKSVAGNTIRSECETAFSHHATGHETFYWRESGGKYRLDGYSIDSKALAGR